MTDTDRESFARGMAMLAEVFGETLSEIRMEAYFLALKAHPVAAVREALCGAIQRFRFFPKPAELLELMAPPMNLDCQAHEALQIAVDHNFHDRRYRFEDPLIHETIRLMGGWEAFCTTVRRMPERDWQFYAKEWRKVYVSCAERGVTEDVIARIGPGTPVECPYLEPAKPLRITSTKAIASGERS